LSWRLMSFRAWFMAVLLAYVRSSVLSSEIIALRSLSIFFSVFWALLSALIDFFSSFFLCSSSLISLPVSSFKTGFLVILGSFQLVEPGNRDFRPDIKMIISIGIESNNAASIHAANWLLLAHSYSSGVTDLIKKYVIMNDIIPELIVFPPKCLIKP